MRIKRDFCLVAFLVLMLSTVSLILQKSQASENQDIEFNIISFGDLSGYMNETYVALRTEAEWADVWEKHTAPYLPESPYPEIDFSEKMVICAFMGRCPTTGYSISVEKMWTDGEKMHVEIAKHSPSEDIAVGQAITQPYVFVSIEEVNMNIVIHITNEVGDVTEYPLPEFPTIATVLFFLAIFSVSIIAVFRRRENNPPINPVFLQI